MNELPLKFLAELKSNNNREWFNENKPRFEEVKKIVEDFANQLIKEISFFDNKISGLDVKKTLFRIYRDVRFSKDKSPYKTAMGSYIAVGGRKSIFAGYYLHIEPNASFLAGGMYCPASENLQKVRQEILYNVDEYKSIINGKTFIDCFDTVKGDKLKRPPKGFPGDFPDVELLKHKDFLVVHNIKDETIFRDDFLGYATNTFSNMKAFNDFLNRSLD